ncbi:MAG: hypothetical protein OEW91_08450, partial [Acidimicrobiia bacterium]|nr:hypothetical protein [Acidimicrobiia bacterium]
MISIIGGSVSTATVVSTPATAGAEVTVVGDTVVVEAGGSVVVVTITVVTGWSTLVGSGGV